MSAIAEHERLFVRSFVAPDQKDRYLGLLATPKGRAKFVAALHHDLRLDTRYAIRLPEGQTRDEQAEAVAAALSDIESEQCLLISSDRRLDGQCLPLAEALGKVIGYGGTVISCMAGVAAYYEGEEAGSRYVCRQRLAA